MSATGSCRSGSHGWNIMRASTEHPAAAARAALLHAALGMLLSGSGVLPAQPLPDSLHLTGTAVTSGTVFQGANQSIAADSGYTVSGGASVVFRAGSSITLGTGFQATAGTAGTTFSAGIAAPDFTLGISPSSSGAGKGLSTAYTVTVTRLYGFAALPALSVTAVPAGAPASFGAPSVNGTVSAT